MSEFEFAHVWTSQDCVIAVSFGASDNAFVIKPLKQLSSFGLLEHNTLLIDDTVTTALENPRNLIPISPFRGGEDDALLRMMEILSIRLGQFEQTADIRE